ncbi:MAG: ATP-dependent sacrificial sulfur transferase LarE [Candidatus Omnitrophica bacterium]|nr:ATP-dependent sacrificial sulfur transferase LarE [Candidatus Omnitrophota bacterium]MBU4479317.1 ATP-dependent sacrificial sulfur transferase LarE [Candidatus Omnitrophota bacterium]
MIGKHKNPEAKLLRLQKMFKAMGSVLIAYSGGVDSSFLLKAAADVLGKSVLAVTATSATYPEREKKQAQMLAARLEVNHITIVSEELSCRGFAENTKERCYWCKKELFTKLSQLAKKYKLRHIVDGATYDDINDYRPGMRAAQEMGVHSPLKDLKFRKEDIRCLSKQLGLPTWDKPSCACLASRFPYGIRITRDSLAMVEKAEDMVRRLGIKQVRVRHHGTIAKIEVVPEDIGLLVSRRIRKKLISGLKDIGYVYVTLDMEGYRTGSMNEVLSKGK